MALQEKLRIQAEPVSPASKARMLSSAAEIENETLRDQNAHLQKKISNLEDSLEDARAAAHADETQLREKLGRYKDKEEAVRRQVTDGEKEVERMLKAEASARARVEEVEEAFREGTVALENAQVEIEGLRAEIAVSGSETSGSTSQISHRTWRASPL
jgi:CAP-Gly domain-containing linker protein 1